MTLKELKDLLKGTLDGDNPKDFIPKHKNLLDALSEINKDEDEDEPGHDNTENETEEDEDGPYVDIFERCNVSMTKVVNVGNVKGPDAKLWIGKGLQARGIEPNGDRIDGLRKQLQGTFKNKLKCFEPKSPELKSAVRTGVVSTTLVDDDFCE